MRVEWLKRRLRGTWIHRLVPRRISQLLTGASPIHDQNAVYDGQTVEVMRRVLRRDSSCIDVGAHRGDILRHMVDLAPEGTHHAFEALPDLAAEIRKRFQRVWVHQVAVADQIGQSQFQHVENDSAYSGLRRRVYDRPDPRITTIMVATTTLDGTIPHDQPIAFIKLDIEGGEFHALQGAAKTIKWWQPVIVFEAGNKSTGQYGVTPGELYRLITATLGYDLSTMRRWLDGGPAYTLEEFTLNWHAGPDYYFIGTARDSQTKLRRLMSIHS